MGFSYVITMAIVIIASITITLFILYSGVIPYVGYVTSTCNILLEYYYFSDNFITIVIKNTGSLYISSIHIKIFQKDNVENSLEIVLNYRVPPSASVTFICERESSSWSCSFEISSVNSKPLPCVSGGSICSVSGQDSFVVTPGKPYMVYVYAMFANKIEKLQYFSVVPVG